MESVKITIKNEYTNYTIKEFLKANNVGRGKIEEIRVKKLAFLNGNSVSLETRIKENDILSFLYCEKVDFLPLDEKIDILYEDDNILIVNKPSNMIIHPDDRKKNGTLVNLVANYYIKNNINCNVRYIHRLDKETTGIILFAKDFLSEAILLKKMQEGSIDRRYLALLEGKLSIHEGCINKPLIEDKINGKMKIDDNGKEAISNYKVIEEFVDYSLVEFSLITGRTHQIRVHASSINHPLLGDILYGGNNKQINRVALHSYMIDFIHPISNEKMHFKIELPNDMKGLVI